MYRENEKNDICPGLDGLSGLGHDDRFFRKSCP